MELRAYQESAIKRLKYSLLNNHKAPILRLDCGAGKTFIAATISKAAVRKGNTVLFLVHRQELKQQTIDAFKEIGLEESEQLKVEMVITAGSKLKEFKPDIIFADECNFALAKSWRKVFENNPQATIIGLSATPVRLSGEAMGNVFDDIIETISAQELVDMGFLSKYKYYAPKIQFDIKQVKNKCGDFDTEELEQMLNTPKIYGDVITNYKKLADHKKTICYCTTIKHSQQTALEFQKAGYKAVHFDGNTPTKERKQIIEDFRTGKIEILCNCDLVSFGFNVPDCECCLLLRPTQSVALYIQQSMRCLRAKIGKMATIIDFVNNCYRFGLPTDTRQYSLQGKLKCDNIVGEPEIKARQCEKCYMVYSGVSRICPYCDHDNGKTRAEIKKEQQAELEQIEKIELVKKKREVGMAKTFGELVEIGKNRGYKNPQYWARMVLSGRKKGG